MKFHDIYDVGSEFASADLNDLPGARKAIADKWLTSPHDLLLTGSTGTGKSFFLHALMFRFTELHGSHDMRYVTANQVDKTGFKQLQDFGTTSGWLERLIDPTYLFIDDLGVERSSDRMLSDWYDIIDQRLMHHRPTVITTNLDLEGIERRYDARIASRMQRYSIKMFGGEDRRAPNHLPQDT